MTPTTYTVWVIQYWSDRIGWWTLPWSARDTRKEAIQCYHDLWNDPLRWGKERRRGLVRCVKAGLTVMEGKE